MFLLDEEPSGSRESTPPSLDPELEDLFSSDDSILDKNYRPLTESEVSITDSEVIQENPCCTSTSVTVSLPCK